MRDVDESSDYNEIPLRSSRGGVEKRRGAHLENEGIIAPSRSGSTGLNAVRFENHQAKPPESFPMPKKIIEHRVDLLFRVYYYII